MSGILQPRSTRTAGREPDVTLGNDAPRFVFMLTRNDVTVRDARSIVPTAIQAGVRHAGAKDIGLPETELGSLFSDLRAAGCTTFLEVVSETPEDALRSARAALRLRPDYLIGGTDIVAISEIIAGSGIRFFPYIGRVVGHPCLLRGSIDEIVSDGQRAVEAGVDGINLLAYRYDGDVERLIAELLASVPVPVLCAGSVDSPDRIAVLRRLGVWGFTIGTAILDRQIAPGRPLAEQLRQVIELAAAAA
jgi:hypothetical protein